MPSGFYISAGAAANPIVPFSASGTIQTKYNVSAISQRRRRSQIPIQLSTVRPVLISKESSFVSAIGGQEIDVGDFLYVSEDGLVTITNISGITIGVSGHVSDSYAIPIDESSPDRFIFSDFHYEEQI